MIMMIVVQGLVARALIRIGKVGRCIGTEDGQLELDMATVTKTLACAPF